MFPSATVTGNILHIALVILSSITPLVAFLALLGPPLSVGTAIQIHIIEQVYKN